MKYFFIALITVLIFAPLAVADTVILNAPEEVNPPTAYKLQWKVDTMDATTKTIIVRYRYLDENNRVITLGTLKGWQLWTCHEQCFDDVFSFQVRAQDVGTPIGAGLRKLLWNKFKQEIIPTNDGVFE